MPPIMPPAMPPTMPPITACYSVTHFYAYMAEACLHS
jgi:hypothetical protein